MKATTRKNLVSTIITILTLALGIGAFQFLSNQKKSTIGGKIDKKERRKVTIRTFESNAITNTIEVDGKLLAQERVAITSKVQGIMKAGPRSIRVGKYFEKGELLYAIDNEEASYNLKALKSSLVTSITQMMPDIKFDYPQSFDKWQSYLENFDVSKNIKSLPIPSNSQEKHFVNGRNLYNQYFQIKSQETRLREYKIFAPFNGVITATNIYPGALISPGQVLCNMINTRVYEIATPIPLNELQYVTTGQSVKLFSEEMNQSWNGKVVRIGTQIDAGTQSIPIYISVSGKNLKDGMYLNGTITAKTLDDVYELPKNIFLSPNSIFTVVDSVLTIKEITSLKRLKENVIVKGISSEDKIVTGSLAGLFEGQKINY